MTNLKNILEGFADSYLSEKRKYKNSPKSVKLANEEKLNEKITADLKNYVLPLYLYDVSPDRVELKILGKNGSNGSKNIELYNQIEKIAKKNNLDLHFKTLTTAGTHIFEDRKYYALNQKSESHLKFLLKLFKAAILGNPDSPYLLTLHLCKDRIGLASLLDKHPKQDFISLERNDTAYNLLEEVLSKIYKIKIKKN